MVSHSATMILPSDDKWCERQPFVPVPAAIGLDASDVGLRPMSIYGTRKASLILDIIVVGCGLGGLGAAFCLTQAGHRVTIIESSSVLSEVGAGIQVSPNCSRLLWRWGLGKHLDAIAVKPEGIAFRRYKTGERVGFTRWAEVLEQNYGAPYYHIHRADLHKLLYDLVAPRVTIRLGATVVGCDPDPVLPSITLQSGEIVRADMIVGADGVKSYMQQVVSGKSNRAEPTGDAAYRATIPASLMMQDPELRDFIEHPQMAGWMGPGRHLMAYPIVRTSLVFRNPRFNSDQIRCSPEEEGGV
jgi:salicylate hydroxylase